MKLKLITLGVISLLVATFHAEAGLKIYYIRHAEGGHNVVNEWKDKPKETWPLYVGNGNILTPKGDQQALAAIDKLTPYHFDYIAVSPLWRCRNTIFPYLKAANRTGVIWPELMELNSAGKWETLPDKTVLPPISVPLFGGGREIKLTEDEGPYFTFRGEDRKEFRMSSEPMQVIVDNHAVIEKLVKLIHQRFEAGDQSILLVGHGWSGSQLVKELTNYSQPVVDLVNKVGIRNTGIWMVEEQADQTFKLMLFNDQPFKELQSDKTPKLKAVSGPE